MKLILEIDEDANLPIVVRRVATALEGGLVKGHNPEWVLMREVEK